MSNPATQNRTAPPMSSGVAMSNSPRMAIQADTGPSIRDAPSQKWARAVKRLVNEYPQTNASTGPDRYKGQQFGLSRTMNNEVEATKPAEHVNMKAATVGTE